MWRRMASVPQASRRWGKRGCSCSPCVCEGVGLALTARTSCPGSCGPWAPRWSSWILPRTRSVPRECGRFSRSSRRCRSCAPWTSPSIPLPRQPLPAPPSDASQSRRQPWRSSTSSVAVWAQTRPLRKQWGTACRRPCGTCTSVPSTCGLRVWRSFSGPCPACRRLSAWASCRAELTARRPQFWPPRHLWGSCHDCGCWTSRGIWWEGRLLSL
mmetsp:Transcript_70449/g.210050  ORF Transcript_70449/g.210050 Transcript_70449/m.210050 type:complete len:213 (+) Transcript_70449:818-1456(+)